MADSREIGMRVGAAFNQASNIVAALVAAGAIATDPLAIIDATDTVAGALLEKMNDAQAAASVEAGFGPTQQAAAPAAAPRPAAAPAASGASAKKPPLKLYEHPELPAWLHAQAQAFGVVEVWDNRGHENYIAAINSGAKTTPPPFRSATKGVDKSFWPPKD